jgi:hypothetical protein
VASQNHWKQRRIEPSMDQKNEKCKISRYSGKFALSITMTYLLKEFRKKYASKQLFTYQYSSLNGNQAYYICDRK